MKKRYILTTMFLAMTLTGCSALNLLPKKHDGAAFMSAVNLRVNLNYVKCDSDQDWQSVIADAEKIALYAEVRGEAQAENATSLLDNINKAAEGGPLCGPMLTVAKSKTDIIIEAWRGRR